MSVITVPSTSFTSRINSVTVENDEYGGAHQYWIKEIKGREPETKELIFVEDPILLQFYRKANDGSGLELQGILDDQLLSILIDRLAKLNASFPDPLNSKMIGHLWAVKSCIEKRVKERLDNGKLGLLVK